MSYKFEKMTQNQAEDIAYNWHYDDIYSFYDMEADKEDLMEFLDPKKRNNSYFVVIDDDEVVGFFSFSKTDNNTIDIGLGMKPSFTGKGKGFEFIKSGIEYVKVKYASEKITLSVATFNKRAIKVYKKVGFQEVETFIQNTNGSSFEFLKMIYIC